MGAQEDVALVRRGYEAFNAGDMDTLRELFTEGAVWRVGGSGALSGAKQGRDAILAYFGELGSRSNGTVKVDLEDVSAGDRYVIGVQSNHAERDGKFLDQRSALVFTLADGMVTEVLELQEDTGKASDFWS
ncbi:nuclear transport factor 2 family protein [Pseudarthrobacter sp. fls2-241-R2A-168]|jgi:ketosteroid isomerase-like protein|uniref:nuclear transport factor 2 family protein n=1 Tax=Pseudarthrobacter sp. fls2-241-R2A-168 TaxID=3040304 RepID=UPI00255212FE|nr:nuclear transport factor 2 family protein [Pseudarthrobacter sp. fls2-241-R2A-168]